MLKECPGTLVRKTLNNNIFLVKKRQMLTSAPVALVKIAKIKNYYGKMWI
jgi:hypothetical protein